jgi:hypothetical protein
MRARLDSDSAGLGDPVGLRLAVTLPAGARVAFPGEGDSLGAWKVLKADPVRRMRDDGWERLERYLKIAGYRLGEIGPDTLRLSGLSAAGESLRFAYSPQRLRITSQIPPGQVDPSSLRDIKDVVRTGRPAWPWLVGAGILTAAGFVLLLRRLRRKKVTLLEAPPVPGPTAEEEFENAIASLLRSGLLEQGRYREFYYGVSSAVRLYLERTHGLPLLESTSSEVIELLSPRIRDREVRNTLRDWLVEGDLVKYARMERLQMEARTYLERSRELVRLLAASVVAPSVGGQS